MALPKKKRRTSNIGRLGLECEFIKYSEKKKHVEYDIKITCLANQETWIIKKRYNDFYSLNTELEKDRNFRGIALPHLPPKKIALSGSTSKELAEERKESLQDYLNGIISRTVFLSSPAIKAFLNMPGIVRDLANILSQRQSASLKEGHMYKKGAYNKKWKKRYFVLQPNYILKYYKEMASHEPQGSIDISTVFHIGSKQGNTDKKYSFTLKSHDRTWFLACNNESDKREWTRMFMRLKDTKAPPKIKNDKDKINKMSSKQNINISNQHFGSVTTILWSPTIPGILATGSEDETVKIWQTQLLDNTLIPPEYDEQIINKMLSVDKDDKSKLPIVNENEKAYTSSDEGLDEEDEENDTTNNNINNNNNKNKLNKKNEDDNNDEYKNDTKYTTKGNNNNNYTTKKALSTYPLHAIEFTPIAEYKTSGRVTCLQWSPDGSMIVVSLTKDTGNVDDNDKPIFEYFIQTFDLRPILGFYDDDDFDNSVDDDDNNNEDDDDNDKNQRTKIFTLQDHPSALLFSHDGNHIYMSMNIDPNSEENEKRRPAFLVYLDLSQNQLHRCKTVDRIIDHQTEFIVALSINNIRNVMVVATSTHQGKGRLLAWDIEKNETRIVERKGTRISYMKFTEDDSWLIIARYSGSIEFWNVYNENNKKLSNYYKDIKNGTIINKKTKDKETNNNNDDNNDNNDTDKGDNTKNSSNNVDNNKKSKNNKHKMDEVEFEKAPSISIFERKFTMSGDDAHSGPVFSLCISNGILISSSKPNNLGYESFYCHHILWDVRNLMNYGLIPKKITKLHNINDNEKDITRLLDLSPTTPRHVREGGGGPGTLLAASGDQSIYCHNLMDVMLDAIVLGRIEYFKQESD